MVYNCLDQIVKSQMMYLCIQTMYLIVILFNNTFAAVLWIKILLSLRGIDGRSNICNREKAVNLYLVGIDRWG